jgi:hypothetical protein
MPKVVVDQVVEAPQQHVWDAVTDWNAQSQWVLATDVAAAPDGGRRVGGELVAVTGVAVPGGWLRRRFGARLGVRDPMVVIEWDPPRRCVVKHLGSVVRGLGIIEVVELPDGRSQLVWTEDVELPMGRLGRWGWPAARPLTAWGIARSLRRFATGVEAGA